MNYKAMQARSIEHAANPQPGDYWHEMFMPQALVLEVGEFHVSYLTRTKPVDTHHWTFDTSHVEVKSRAEFRDWLSYGHIPGTWAMVEANWAHWQEFADDAKEDASSAAGGVVTDAKGRRG